MFFWFFPPGPQGSLDDLIFWYIFSIISNKDTKTLKRTNGGPGCSSLEGAFQENGVSKPPLGPYIRVLTELQPITWSWGQALPTQNEFSWTNLSSILFVEQPIGTGFSEGTPNIAVSMIDLLNKGVNIQ